MFNLLCFVVGHIIVGLRFKAEDGGYWRWCTRCLKDVKVSR